MKRGRKKELASKLCPIVLIFNCFPFPQRTCGYVVGIKHNKGGLTRHLSLVHQREYKDYTARMDKNWTHGMMERNLSMRVPKNI